MQEASYAKLLAIHSKLFELTEYDTIIDFMVNDTHKVIQYQLAACYKYKSKKDSKTDNYTDLEIVELSGTINHEVNKEFNKWLKQALEYFNNHEKNKKSSENDIQLIIFHSDTIDSSIKETWAENLGQEVVIAKIYRNDGECIDLIIFNNEQHQEDEIINFNLLAKSYQQALKLNKKDEQRTKKSKITPKLVIKALVLLFLGAMFIPMTPSVMAPAEIISEKTWSVNAPIFGRIENVTVEPNTIIKKDELLFTFDQIDLENNLRLVEQELNILETDQDQARALGFNNKEERAKIFQIKQDIEAKNQEIIYAKQQIELSKVKSPSSGIILYKSKDDLLGKPVKVGESVMRVADVNSKIIEIWLGIDDSITLNKNMDVYYYSNKDPFSSILAKLDYFSYEAYITPQEKIAYRLLAKLDQPDRDLIIGDHGQVKIYGLKRLFMGQFIFQKPMASLRQWFYKAV